MSRRIVSIPCLFITLSLLLFANFCHIAYSMNITSNDLCGISMISDDFGFIVGDHGMILNWDGNSWHVVQSPAAQQLLTVDMVKSDDGWAGGADVLLHWDGHGWTNATYLVNGMSSGDHWVLRGISMVSSAEGWAAGWWGRTGQKESGLLLHWDGARWTVSAGYGSLPPLHDISMIGSSTGFAVASYYLGEVFQDVYEFNGLSWIAIHEGDGGFGSVFAVGSSDVWITLPNYCELIHWNGFGWSNMSLPKRNDGGTYLVNALFFTSKNDGWTAGNCNLGPPAGIKGDEVAIFHWNGAAWQEQTAIDFNGTYAQTPPQILHICMVSEASGWAVGPGGTIFRWNGNAWNIYATSYQPAPLWSQYWFWIPVVIIVGVVIVSFLVVRNRRKLRGNEVPKIESQEEKSLNK